MSRQRMLSTAIVAMTIVSACNTRSSVGTDAIPESTVSEAPTAACTEPGEWGECDVDGYDDRPYEVYVPSGYDPNQPLPVVLALHGGGGNSGAAAKTTCPGGDMSDPACIHNLAEEYGFVVVFPNGIGSRLLPRSRTWNAGGGTGGFNCVSGRACDEDVDDVTYIGQVLDDVESRLAVDTGMVFSTGISNGGAMAHRLACELSDRIVAIAPVGGLNQFAAVEPCEPTEPVSILQIHGSDDPCWTYEASDQKCADQTGGMRVGAVESTVAWAERLGCAADPTTDALPDGADDGTSTVTSRWTGCDGGVEVELWTIEGGGHTWPGGHQYLPAGVVGSVTEDWDTRLIWEWLADHGR